MEEVLKAFKNYINDGERAHEDLIVDTPEKLPRIKSFMFDELCRCYFYDITVSGQNDLKVALENFQNLSDATKEKAEELVYKNWQNYNEAVGFLDAIEVFADATDESSWQYKSLQRALWLEKLKNPEQVWEYLEPDDVMISEHAEDGDAQIYITATYKCAWEEEHGLKIVFENGKEIYNVGGVDGCPR